MQPNNPYTPEPSGIDYLNQIAAPAAPTGFDAKSKVIMIVAGIVCMIALVFIAFTTLSSSNNSPSPVALSAKLQVLQKLSTKYGPKLRTTALQDTNSALSAALITANQSMNSMLSASGVDQKTATKQIAQLAGTSEMEKTLDDAHLNSTLDETYRREIIFQLQDTLVMLERTRRATNSPSAKELLEKIIVDLQNLYKQFGGTIETDGQAVLLRYQLVA